MAVDVESALDHLRGNPRAILATLRADGQPAMSPVAATVDAEGRVVISTRETAYKVTHLRRHPKAWLCGITEKFYGPWVQVEGDVEIVSLPDAMEPLVDYYRRVAGEHPDWDDYRAAMEREQRCLLRITVTRAGPSKSG